MMDTIYRRLVRRWLRIRVRYMRLLAEIMQRFAAEAAELASRRRLANGRLAS